MFSLDGYEEKLTSTSKAVICFGYLGQLGPRTHKQKESEKHGKRKPRETVAETLSVKSQTSGIRLSIPKELN